MIIQLALVFVLSFVLTYIVIVIARKHAIMDVPNERSSHTIPTPRGGGLALAIAWFAGLSWFYFNGKIEQNLFFALLCGIIISGVSFIDDIINLKALPRLIIQSIATIMALYFIGGLHKIDLGFAVIENAILLSVMAFFAIIWFINLYNFIDGIDGYAATEAIFVCAAMFLLIGNEILLILCFAVLGFLPWNWQKAKIFMGDVGSTLLGFNIAIFAVYFQNTNESSIMIWIIITTLFWFDATLTIFRRLVRKEKLSQAHRKHAYQRIVQAGFSHQKTVLCGMLINVLGFGIVFLAVQNVKYLVLLLLLHILICFAAIKWIDKLKPF